MKRITLVVLILASVAYGQAIRAGTYIASDYGQWRVPLQTAATANSVSSAVTMSQSVVAGPNGFSFSPFTLQIPIIVDGGSSQTPTAVSHCALNDSPCVVTATWNGSYNHGSIATSGSFGLQEAIELANKAGGGRVIVDRAWSALGGTDAIITAALVRPGVFIEDDRSGIRFWKPSPATLTFIATPTALTAQAACDSTHTFCSDASVVGTWTSGTLYGCVAYVDVMGNEGACSTTANFTTVVSKAVDVGAPAASTGAVGYTVYLSLVGGTYAFAYKVPITSSICTMTSVETITAACAVTNSTYGQTGSNAVVAGVTVNTARLAPQLGVISSTTDYVPNSNAHTVYNYQPSSNVGQYGVVGSSVPFTAGAAAATTVPSVIGSITLPAGFMNYIGRTIRVCGLASESGNGSTSTVTEIEFLWDADGSNVAGVPPIIHGPRTTSTLPGSAVDQWTFCQNLKTTVSGASATAGSIQAGTGFLTETSGANGTATAIGWGTAPTVFAAAVGSLNLAGEARIDIVYLHTTGTDAAGVTLSDLTVEVLN